MKPKKSHSPSIVNMRARVLSQCASSFDVLIPSPLYYYRGVLPAACFHKIPNVRTVEAKDALIKRFGGKKKDDIVVPGQITELVTFEDAYSAGEGVTEYEPNGAAAEEILTLWSWIKKASGVENGQEKNVA
jgi:hypothetical protein